MKLTHILMATTVTVILAITLGNPEVKPTPPEVYCWTNTLSHSATMKHRTKCEE